MTAPQWRRLDVRTALVRCGWLLPPLGGTLITLLAARGDPGPRLLVGLGGVVIGFLTVAAVRLIRWRTTRYRIDDTAVRLEWRLVARHHRIIRLGRIRSVDVTATPAHRLLGIAVVRIGSAGDDADLVLDAVPVAQADRLRAALRGHTVADPATLARWHRHWWRYAPLTLWVFGGVGIAVGTAFRVAEDFGVRLWELGPLREAVDAFGDSALWLTVPALLLSLTTIGAIGAVALGVENWSGYRLERRGPGTLSVRRGLLTTRSVDIDRSRLYGAVLREPLPLRAGGGAAVTAVAGGLGDAEQARRRGGLLPPAPRDEAVRVVAAVTGADAATVARPPLTGHPTAARRRRLFRGLLWVTLPGGAALAALAPLSPVLLPVTAGFVLLSSVAVGWWARAAHRALGHGVLADLVALRSGTLNRRTVLLRREAVASWSFTTNPFTRRRGLVTVTAAVSGGEHGYRCPDLGAAQAIELATTATPGVLDDFLADPVR